MSEYLSLQERLAEEIAARDGIAPEDVTVRYIHRQRQLYIYPQMMYRGDPRTPAGRWLASPAGHAALRRCFDHVCD